MHRRIFTLKFYKSEKEREKGSWETNITSSATRKILAQLFIICWIYPPASPNSLSLSIPDSPQIRNKFDLPIPPHL